MAKKMNVKTDSSVKTAKPKAGSGAKTATLIKNAQSKGGGSYGSRSKAGSPSTRGTMKGKK